jgi:hypothetical protein
VADHAPSTAIWNTIIFLGLAMSTGRHSFKHNDAARLIRASEAAGLKVKAVTLDGNRVTVLVDDGNASTDNTTNPWDEVRAKNAKNEKRAS